MADLRRKLVHLVEDDKQMRRLMGRRLRSSEFDVEERQSGDKFLARLDDIAPGCVPLDITMPSADGFAVQGALRERGSAWPVIRMTGAGDTSIVALKAGALDLTNQPFGPPELLSIIDQAFELLSAGAETNATQADAAP